MTQYCYTLLIPKYLIEHNLNAIYAGFYFTSSVNGGVAIRIASNQLYITTHYYQGKLDTETVDETEYLSVLYR